MVIGARIRNDGGSLVQIDPSFECLGLKEAATTISVPSYTVPGGGGRTIGKTTISSAGCNEPILALFCGASFVGVMSRSQSGSTFSWEIVTEAAGASVTYWIFDTTDVAQIQFSLTKGLRIRNASNNRVIFDSRYKYMRILQVVNRTVGTAEVNESIPLTSGYAVGFSVSGLYTRVDGGPVGGGPSWLINSAGYVVGVRCNSNGTISGKLVELRATITDGPAPPYPPTGIMGDNTLRGLVLDMRNY